jgi:hypothetical protein
MRQFIISCLVLMVLSATGYASAPQIAPFNHFHEELRYWGGDEACEKVLNNSAFHESLLSSFVPGQGGMIYMRLHNPSASQPPIDTYLFKDGDSDRYGFTNYYSPDISTRVNHHAVGVRGIILNICMDGQKQSAVMIDVAPNKTCIVSTHAWNYCR